MKTPTITCKTSIPEENRTHALPSDPFPILNSIQFSFLHILKICIPLRTLSNISLFQKIRASTSNDNNLSPFFSSEHYAKIEFNVRKVEKTTQHILPQRPAPRTFTEHCRTLKLTTSTSTTYTKKTHIKTPQTIPQQHLPHSRLATRHSPLATRHSPLTLPSSPAPHIIPRPRK
jgi:hypothetical protein